MSEGSCREGDVQKHRLQTSLSSGSTQAGEPGRKTRRHSFADKSTMKDGGRGERDGEEASSEVASGPTSSRGSVIVTRTSERHRDRRRASQAGGLRFLSYKVEKSETAGL